MRAFLKFDYNLLTKKILEDKLSDFGYKYSVQGFGEIEFHETVPEAKLEELRNVFDEYGITIIENQKSVLVQKIKDIIHEMIYAEEVSNVKVSVYLAEKLNYSYAYLSNLFSDITYTSIENYIIIQKIEFAKQLFLNDKLSLTEIAFRLNYSSVAHLSKQFKNVTGITPTAFLRIIATRRERNL
jgi:AraC-like DNA-binding protein